MSIASSSDRTWIPPKAKNNDGTEVDKDDATQARDQRRIVQKKKHHEVLGSMDLMVDDEGFLVPRDEDSSASEQAQEALDDSCSSISISIPYCKLMMADTEPPQTPSGHRSGKSISTLATDAMTRTVGDSQNSELFCLSPRPRTSQHNIVFQSPTPLDVVVEKGYGGSEGFDLIISPLADPSPGRGPGFRSATTLAPQQGPGRSGEKPKPKPFHVEPGEQVIHYTRNASPSPRASPLASPSSSCDGGYRESYYIPGITAPCRPARTSPDSRDFTPKTPKKNQKQNQTQIRSRSATRTSQSSESQNKVMTSSPSPPLPLMAAKPTRLSMVAKSFPQSPSSAPINSPIPSLASSSSSFFSNNNLSPASSGGTRRGGHRRRLAFRQERLRHTVPPPHLQSSPARRQLSPVRRQLSPVRRGVRRSLSDSATSIHRCCCCAKNEPQPQLQPQPPTENATPHVTFVKKGSLPATPMKRKKKRMSGSSSFRRTPMTPTTTPTTTTTTTSTTVTPSVTPLGLEPPPFSPRKPPPPKTNSMNSRATSTTTAPTLSSSTSRASLSSHDTSSNTTMSNMSADMMDLLRIGSVPSPIWRGATTTTATATSPRRRRRRSDPTKSKSLPVTPTTPPPPPDRTQNNHHHHRRSDPTKSKSAGTLSTLRIQQDLPVTPTTPTPPPDRTHNNNNHHHRRSDPTKSKSAGTLSTLPPDCATTTTNDDDNDNDNDNDDDDDGEDVSEAGAVIVKTRKVLKSRRRLYTPSN